MSHVATLALALLVPLLALSCASEERAPEPDLPGIVGAWTIAEVLGTEVAGEGVVLTLGSDGSLSGHTGVNSLTGSYEMSEGALSFSPLATTRMAGPPELMDQEVRFTEALGRTRRGDGGEDGRLALKDDAGETLILATPRP